MNNLSFMGANLVAQQLDWSMTEGWGQGDAAANAYYEPIETFPERFAAFLTLASDVGFRSVDVWTGQLNWAWATDAHLRAAREALDEAGMMVASYAGLYGDTPEELRTACATASALGTRILGGNAGLLFSDRPTALAILRDTGRILAIENHPESSPQQILDKIGDDGDGALGTAVDTGWWGTQGFDAAEAIRQLGTHVTHVHLKDIRAVGAHETCALGDGVVPVQDCVHAIFDVGYAGPISIEHEPDHHDPMPEVIVSKVRLEQWLTARDGATPVSTVASSS